VGVFETIGSINKISPVYQTPALEFEGNDFMNCVIEIESTLSTQKLLNKILSIEKKMGRIRNKEEGNNSRLIDIDIISIDDLVKKTKTIQLPHPRAHKRKFVLQPLHDINPEFIHPKSKKSITTLLKKCTDTSILEKQSKWLRNPKKDFTISNYNYIAIEGNIGAGKTSLATLISSDFNAKLILERFKDNPFLPKFYEDQQRYAFPLEMSFLADRYQQLLDDISQYDLFKDFIVSDYDVYKSLIFAKVTLQEEEFVLYKKLFNLMHKDLAKPDIYVYLYQTTESLLRNIKKRGRNYEQDIEVSYLEKINKGYLEFIRNQQNLNVKIIDISEKDFVKNRKDYIDILKEIVN